MHGGIKRPFGKTGIGLLRYSPNPIVAVIDQESAGESLTALLKVAREVPIVHSVRESLAYQPDTLVIGTAPSGGQLPPEWLAEVRDALTAGLNLVNGLHTPLAQHPELKPLLRSHQWVWDIRQEPSNLSVGTGKARYLTCKRVLTVGTDMAVGKMTVSLEMHRACLARGMRSRFLATGQTGIMIEGYGVPLDAVRVDYASGAVEKFTLELGQEADVVHIEGQGALFNPASTATLPLLRGTQPTHLILVHRAGQTHIRTFPDVPIPPLREAVALYEAVAQCRRRVLSLQSRCYRAQHRASERNRSTRCYPTGRKRNATPLHRSPTLRGGGFGGVNCVKTLYKTNSLRGSHAGQVP